MWKAERVGAWGGRRRARRRWGTGPRRSGGSGTGGRALFEYAHSGGTTQGRDTKAEGKENGLVGPPPHPARPADTHTGHWEGGLEVASGVPGESWKGHPPPLPSLWVPSGKALGGGSTAGTGGQGPPLRPLAEPAPDGAHGQTANPSATHWNRNVYPARDWTEREPRTTRPITPAKSPNRRCGPRAVKSAPPSPTLF